MMREFLDAGDLVARYNGKVSSKTLANWRSTGNGPAYVKIGGRVMYPLERVEEWEAARELAGLSKRTSA
jgi:hypothetical protein